MSLVGAIGGGDDGSLVGSRRLLCINGDVYVIYLASDILNFVAEQLQIAAV